VESVGDAIRQATRKTIYLSKIADRIAINVETGRYIRKKAIEELATNVSKEFLQIIQGGSYYV
jgi:hypothetical protein